MRFVNFLCFFYCAIATTTANADELMDLKLLEAAAKSFLKAEIEKTLAKPEKTTVEISIRPLDARLRLASCDNNLTFERKNTQIQQRTSIKARCQGSKPWSTFMMASVSLMQPVAVVKGELPRLHILTEDDLTTVIRDIASLRGGYHTDIDTLVGMQLKRNARAGNVVYNFQLQLPDIIKKGDLVTVLTRRGSLVVSAPGVAMNSGSKGEKIRVENQRSARVIQARITGPGSVEVIL